MVLLGDHDAAKDSHARRSHTLTLTPDHCATRALDQPTHKSKRLVLRALSRRNSNHRCASKIRTPSPRRARAPISFILRGTSSGSASQKGGTTFLIQLRPRRRWVRAAHANLELGDSRARHCLSHSVIRDAPGQPRLRTSPILTAMVLP